MCAQFCTQFKRECKEKKLIFQSENFLSFKGGVNRQNNGGGKFL